MIPIPSDGIYMGVIGVESATSVPCVEDVIITAKQGQRLQKLPEGASYLGFIFARAENPNAVEQALRAAHEHLQFDIAPELGVIRPS